MKQLNLDTVAYFSWDFGNRFFLETEFGLYEWSDPDYPNGDNSIRKSKFSSLKEYYNETDMLVRSKGKHRVGDYCGDNVKIFP